MSPCSLPAESGPCQAAIPAFYYDQDSASCRQFTYGGCGGNANRFSSASECLTACSPDGRWYRGLLCRMFHICYLYTPETTTATPTAPLQTTTATPTAPLQTTTATPTAPLQTTTATPTVPPKTTTLAETAMPPVTESPVTPVALHVAVCPTVQPGRTPTPCPTACSSNQDCTGGQMCCSSGCGGRGCIDPDRVPYYEVPRQCPREGNASCTTRRPSCTDDSVCAANQLCCQVGNCGRFCVAGVESSQPCLAVRERLLVGGKARPGAYVPACQDNGLFAPTQFHGSTGYSWCVNVETGYPVSAFYPRGITAQCLSERVALYKHAFHIMK